MTTTGSQAFPKSKYANKNLQFLDSTFRKIRVISNIKKGTNNQDYDKRQHLRC